MLTSRAGVTINCDRGEKREPNSSLIQPGLIATVNWMKNSNDPIFSRKERTLVDIGCGMYGSFFAEIFETQVSGTHVHWVDREPRFISTLSKPAAFKHCASAEMLPFQDKVFDLALVQGVQESGLSRFPSAFMQAGDPTGLQIAKESARVLSPGGLLMISFSHGTVDPKETLLTLREAGFASISHIYRLVWYSGLPTDLYACRKEA